MLRASEPESKARSEWAYSSPGIADRNAQVLHDFQNPLATWAWLGSRRAVMCEKQGCEEPAKFMLRFAFERRIFAYCADHAHETSRVYWITPPKQNGSRTTH